MGAVFLILKLTSGPATSDGEYLVSEGEWILDGDSECADNKEKAPDESAEANTEDKTEESSATDCAPNVVWKFTAIGKGTLTTNAHKNDYDFAWALEDEKMKVRTDWLYEMDNEYDYTLNREDGILTLKSGEKEYRFASQR
jgi:hypothetical protein